MFSLVGISSSIEHTIGAGSVCPSFISVDVEQLFLWM